MSNLSHRQAIKNDLIIGLKITAKSAIEDYRCYRLAARIHELRKHFHIVTEMVGEGKSKHAVYYMKREMKIK